MYMNCRVNRLFLAFLLSLFVCTSDGATRVATQSTSTIAPRVKKVVDAAMRRYQVPGVAIALYVHGEPYLFNFGYADKKKKTPITTATVFELGSVSKIFTCVLLAQQVHNGCMRLSAPIGDYIPELSRNKRLKRVTLEKLATHTSTLPFNAPERIKSKEAFLTGFFIYLISIYT